MADRRALVTFKVKMVDAVKYVDEPRYSGYIGNRIAQAMSARGWTQSKLSTMLGITNNTLSRMISGQERLNMNLCCKAMRLMNFDPQLLLSKESIVGTWTGIRAIDAMLQELYTDNSPSGVETLRRYTTKDYLCCSPLYTSKSLHSNCNFMKDFQDRSYKKEIRENIVTVYDKQKDGHTMLGITYDLERDLNRMQAQDTYWTKEIKQASLVDENRIIVSAIRRMLRVDSDALSSEHNNNDIYQLKNSFHSINKGAKVQIQRKTWFIDES
tara:strand:+ start:77 stop:883 length:807 start_codon:yes stop_codon:yes gene_type:complete